MTSPKSAPPRRIVMLLAVLVVGAVMFAGYRLTASGARDSEPPASVALMEAGVPVTGLRPDQAPRPHSGTGGTATHSGGQSQPATVTVHVAGPVVHPGVVVLPGGTRVADAIEACGGFRADAPAVGINLARLLVDGERLDVDAPTVGRAGQVAGAAAEPSPIDLNSATVEQFQELPGVGPVLAERIADYREEHGRFASVDQLQEVPGIGARRLSDLADRVIVGPG